LWLSAFLLAEVPPLRATALNSMNSLAIAGPWWGSRNIVWALLFIVIIAAAAFLWAALLLQQVRTKSRELQSTLEAKRRLREFEFSRNEVLETIARNAPLPESMERLALALEQRISGSVCVIAMAPNEAEPLAAEAAPAVVAPSLAEELQVKILPVLSSLLQRVEGSGGAGEHNDSVTPMLEILRASGLDLPSGDKSVVVSGNRYVAGVVVLLLKDAESEESRNVLRNGLLSASRLLLLATEHSSMHERLLHEAMHDRLTGLPNRAVAEDRLEQALARAQRHTKVFAVLCLDLDGFKAINDELGHDTGDEVLRAIAGRLRAHIRHSDTLARMGGDEFWAILEDCSDHEHAQIAAQSLIKVLEEPVSINGRQLTVSASFGIAMYPADGANATQLKRHADQAMYRAKSNGGRQIAFWSEGRSLEKKSLGLSAKVL
jgi:diguanylate cyclase (GGDEF)-like protein